MAVTIRQVCQDAAQEIGVYAQSENLNAGDAASLLGLLRRLLNAWNADRRAVYATRFDEFTLIPNLSPTQIGPGADFNMTQRPVSIDGANLILNTSVPNVNTPITIRDAAWWLKQTVPDLTSTFPTDLYYQPDWPNGKLYFWPVPGTAYDVQLMSRVLLSDAVVLGDTFTLPPGYQNAITLTLAEMALRPFGRPPDATLSRDASVARAAMFDNNITPVRIKTKDAGMTPGPAGNRADFNWLTGQIV